MNTSIPNLQIARSNYALCPGQNGAGPIIAQASGPRKFFSAGSCAMISGANHVYGIGLDPFNKSSNPDYYLYAMHHGYHARKSLYPNALKTNSHSMYDVASLTKSAVTLLVLWAVTNDLVSLGRKVKDFFPNLTVLGSREPTIHDLLTYGVRFQLDHLIKPYSLPPNELLKSLTTANVSVCNFSYSNYPLIMLALILENITGMKLPDIAQKHLFGPLGMQATFAPDAINSQSENEVGRSVYVATEVKAPSTFPSEGVVHDEFTQSSGLLGASGLFTGAEELIKLMPIFFQKGCINGEQFISEELIVELGKNQFTSGTPFGLGFGLWSSFAAGYDPMIDDMKRVNPDYAEGAFFKAGFTGCILACFPAIETGVVITTNMVHPHRHPSPSWRNRFLYCAVMGLLSGQFPQDAKALWSTGLEKWS